MIDKQDLKSAIPYVDDLSSNWEIIPNKFLFYNDGVKVGDDWIEYQLLSLTTSGIQKRDINNIGGKVPISYNTYQTVKKGQLVFCLFDLDCSAVFSGISYYDGMITSAYDVFSTTERYVARYADYWFRYVFSNRYYKLYSKNIRYSVTSDTFGALKSPVPPIYEQQKIADYLDKKCSDIDKLISLKLHEIETLKEYKKSLIYECVTGKKEVL